jgi:hypothetical protein
MMKSKSLTASSLRIILIISLFLIAGLAAVGFSFVTDGLRTTATDTSTTLAEADASRNNVQVLQQVQKELQANKDVIERASSIVAESQSYQYQDQIIKDITDYATRSNITITNFDFGETKSAGNTSNSTTAPSTPQAAKPAGVNSTTVSITLQNPVNYNRLLLFIHSIEQNLTKMQISTVSLSREASGNITSDALKIEVYIR